MLQQVGTTTPQACVEQYAFDQHFFDLIGNLLLDYASNGTMPKCAAPTLS
jgi:hypothetical protein